MADRVTGGHMTAILTNIGYTVLQGSHMYIHAHTMQNVCF